MSLLNIGFSGLNASQIALNISAQNIANVNTIGYSRQEAMMGSLSGFGRMDNGMGVEVTGVRRITDDYLVSQHWRSRSSTEPPTSMKVSTGQYHRVSSRRIERLPRAPALTSGMATANAAQRGLSVGSNTSAVNASPMTQLPRIGKRPVITAAIHATTSRVHPQGSSR